MPWCSNCHTEIRLDQYTKRDLKEIVKSRPEKVKRVINAILRNRKKVCDKSNEYKDFTLRSLNLENRTIDDILGINPSVNNNNKKIVLVLR
jgi:hypothetical protein